MTNAGAGGFFERVGSMAPVSLAELNSGAELLTRTDRKYIVSTEQSTELIAAFADHCAVLEMDARRSFSYATTYHDTPARRLYRDTAHRRPQRFKVRLREYIDSGLWMLEVKTKNGRGRTVKHRMNVAGFSTPPQTAHGPLTDEMVAAIDGVLDTDLTMLLEPALRIDFQRTTLLTDAGASRCTIDIGLRGTDPHGRAVAPDMIVIETKSADRASEIDRWLWAHGTRPARMSKYCTLTAALDSSLPANHWHRQLNTYFAPRLSPAV